MLEEIERVTELHYCIANSLQKSGFLDHYFEWLREFQDVSSIALSTINHLFQSPLELASKITKLSRDMKGLKAGDSEDTYKSVLESTMLSIIKNTLSFWKISTNTEKILTTDPNMLTDSEAMPSLYASMGGMGSETCPRYAI